MVTSPKEKKLVTARLQVIDKMIKDFKISINEDPEQKKPVSENGNTEAPQPEKETPQTDNAHSTH